jgi:hypothetical protein
MLRPKDALLAPRKTIFVIAGIFASALGRSLKGTNKYQTKVSDGRGNQLINVNFGGDFRS